MNENSRRRGGLIALRSAVNENWNMHRLLFLGMAYTAAQEESGFIQKRKYIKSNMVSLT